MIQNPSHFKFSSDYVVPNVAYSIEDTVRNNTGHEYDGLKKITHNLGYTPLVFGVWSTQSDFSVSSGIVTPGGDSGEIGGKFEVIATDQYIYISAYDEDWSGDTPVYTPHTYYFKIYAYAPPEKADSVAPKEDDTKFLFNTDDNYLQLVHFGKITPSSGQLYFNHNLGYTPVYLAWQTTKRDMWWDDHQGSITISGLAVAESFGTHTSSSDGVAYGVVATPTKIEAKWRYQTTANDYAYFQIFTEAG